MRSKLIFFGPRVRLICDGCGTAFLRAAADRQRFHAHQYCSNACAHAAPRAKKPPNCICNRCGAPYHARPWRVRQGKTQYCSQACYFPNVSHAWKRGIDPAVRFWSFVDKSGECWLWTSGNFPSNSKSRGYGSFWLNGRNIGAHRAAWIFTHGPILESLSVLHSCPGGDNPRCVNPAHLRIGSDADNGRDRAERGQAAMGERNGKATHPESTVRGSSHGMARLTDAAVLSIRAEAARGQTTHREQAARYGVTRDHIASIVQGRTWRHLL